MIFTLVGSLIGKKAKPLGMRPSPAAHADTCRLFGRVLERALAQIGMPKKEAAALLGYADQSSIGDWVSGVQAPQILRLFDCLGEEFQVAFALALAKEKGIAISYTLTASDRKFA